MALHCKTPARRNGRSIVPNRSEPETTADSKIKQPNSRKTPPLARRRGAIGDNGSTLYDAFGLDLRGQI